MQELESLFHSAEAVTANIGEDSKSDEVLIATINIFENCARLISNESLFSDNEEIDDCSTNNIKYLAVNYYMAKLKCEIRDLYTRKYYLLEARKHYQDYLNTLIQLKIVKEIDYAYSESRSKVRSQQIS